MISRIEALNYRGLQYVSQDLAPFQILVGPNASGKSTFLDVIAFLSDFVKDGLDDSVLFRYGSEKGRASHLEELIFNQNADHFELAIELDIPEHLRPERSEGQPSWAIARYGVSIGTTVEGELRLIHESLWVLGSDYRINRLSNEEDMKGLLPLNSAPPSILPSEDALDTYGHIVVSKGIIANETATYVYEKGGGAIQFRTSPRKAALASLPEDPDKFAIAMWVRDLLIDDVHVLAVNSAVMRHPVSPSDSRKFSAEGANLPFLVRDLQKNHQVFYQDWLAHVRTVLPDIREIRVIERPEDRKLYLHIYYESAFEPVPSWLVSDGTLLLLALTLPAYVPEQAMGIFLIEEPENGIHPKIIEAVFQSLSSVYRGQVLVATHSAFFLGLSELNQFLCFTKSDSGAVEIVRGDNLPVLMNWHGEVDLSTLYAGGVLG